MLPSNRRSQTYLTDTGPFRSYPVGTPFGESSRVVVGATAAGRYIAVMIQEDPNDDEDIWDIVAARDLPDKDVPTYEQLLRRRP
jgi:hypothetical protein